MKKVLLIALAAAVLMVLVSEQRVLAQAPDLAGSGADGAAGSVPKAETPEKVEESAGSAGGKASGAFAVAISRRGAAGGASLSLPRLGDLPMPKIDLLHEGQAADALASAEFPADFPSMPRPPKFPGIPNLDDIDLPPLPMGGNLPGGVTLPGMPSGMSFPSMPSLSGDYEPGTPGASGPSETNLPVLSHGTRPPSEEAGLIGMIGDHLPDELSRSSFPSMLSSDDSIRSRLPSMTSGKKSQSMASGVPDRSSEHGGLPSMFRGDLSSMSRDVYPLSLPYWPVQRARAHELTIARGP